MFHPHSDITRPSQFTRQWTPQSSADGVSWRRSRLLRFRRLLDHVEYEYSVLLQNLPADSLPERDVAYQFVEHSEQDDAIPMERAAVFPAQHLIADQQRLGLGRVGRASLVPGVFLDEMIANHSTSKMLGVTSGTNLSEEEILASTSIHGAGSSRASVRMDTAVAQEASSTLAECSSMAGTQRGSVSCSELWASPHGTKSFCRLSEMRHRTQKSFPVWWNPSKEVLQQMVLSEAASNTHQSHADVDPSDGRCVLSPMEFPKLHWDFLGFALIFYDSWATPFQMIFASDMLKLTWMKYGDLGITCFFALDILLNFNTGIVVKRGICFQRDKIVKQYLQSWFWLDLAATIPYDQLYQGASFATLLRFLKIIKFLKTIRLIRLLNTLKSLERTENVYFQLVAESRRLMHMLGILLAVFINVHLFCCMWLALVELAPADTFSNAMHVYFDTYVAVFFALLNGTRLNSQTTSQKLLEMLVAAEQLWLLCIFTSYTIFEALILYGDTAKSRCLRSQVQRYMSRHGLPIKTQIEVLSGLEEARQSMALQKDFISLVSSDLPEELQQKIAFELWEGNLKKLALFARISEWDENFCYALALLCREEVFATNVVLFRETDLAIAAYYVVSGEFQVSCVLLDDDIPSFREGTWVGETSLINPAFRRGLRATSLRLSSVMVVSSSSFQKLLRESDLWPLFEDCMSRELFHGMCGRCGSIGNHFFDKCPAQHVQRLFGFASAKKSTCPCWPSDGSASDVDQAHIRELVDFLYHSEALHLLPCLQELEVYSLCQLETIDIDSMNALLARQDPPGELSRRDKKVLSAKGIKIYRDAIAKGMSEHMATDDNQHLLFLSHYKVEAGTEAALMRSELEQLMDQSLVEDQSIKVPIFLDSEDLTTLSELEQHVQKSFNLVLLLTRGVLSRPWVLVELVTAVRCGIAVVPVQVVKPGVEFKYPTESFYADLLAGKFLDESGMQLLNGCGIDLPLIEHTLRHVFQNIAVIYSPHRPAHVRQAELQELLRICKFDGGDDRGSMNDNLVSSASGAMHRGSGGRMPVVHHGSGGSKTSGVASIQKKSGTLQSPWSHCDPMRLNTSTSRKPAASEVTRESFIGVVSVPE